MKIKHTINITLKHGVADPQGYSIQQALGLLGFDHVEDVRVGKVITLVTTGDICIDDMCKQLLCNPVMEQYEIVKEEILS